MSDPEIHHSRSWLGVILLVALGLRLAAACGLQSLLETRWHRDFLIQGDAEGYWQLAQQIASGGNYAIHNPPRYALRMPGFPALLALPVAFFGPDLFAARLFLAGIGTLGCWLVYRLGTRIFDHQTGLLAAALAAVSPVMVVFTEVILSETAFAVTLLWSLLAGDRLYRQLKFASGNALQTEKPDGLLTFRNLGLASVHTGIAIAAGVTMRPSWILAAPIVAVLLLICCQARMRALACGGIVVGVMIFCLVPWGIRNWRVTGHFTLTTFWMGPSLYDGLNPAATGDSNMAFYDRDRLMDQMDEFEVDQHYRRAAWKFLREHPGRALQLAWAKTVRYWSPWPNADQFGQWWMKVVVGTFSVPIFLFSLFGSFSLVDSREKKPRWALSGETIWSMAILAGPIFYFALIHLFFVSSLRYRLPAEYPLLVLAASGVRFWLPGRRASVKNTA